MPSLSTPMALFADQMYARSKTGISPEAVAFNGRNDFSQTVSYYILRPEVVESFYYLSTLTGDPIYRVSKRQLAHLLDFCFILQQVDHVQYQEWGWEVFQSIEKYCKRQYGYASLKNVEQPNSVEDKMESFFLAETLKYLFLLFDPDSEIDILNKVSYCTLCLCS
jgi:hypothetical protein